MSPDGRPRDQYGNIILAEGAGDGQPRDQYGNIIYPGDSSTMPRDQYGNPIREGAGDGLLPRDQYGNIITTDVNGEPLQDGQTRDAAGNIVVTKNVYITTTTSRNPNDDSAQVQHVPTHKRRASLHLIAAFFTNTSVFCCFFCHFTLKADVSAHGASGGLVANLLTWRAGVLACANMLFVSTFFSWFCFSCLSCVRCKCCCIA